MDLVARMCFPRVTLYCCHVRQDFFHFVGGRFQSSPIGICRSEATESNNKREEKKNGVWVVPVREIDKSKGYVHWQLALH